MSEEPEPSFHLRVFNLKKDDQFRFLDLLSCTEISFVASFIHFCSFKNQGN